MQKARYLTAKEVAAMLNINVATVYAYVSRGLIRSEPAGKNNRARIYIAEDVQKLLDQKVYRHDPARVADNAMHWGMPILESALTHITEDCFYYRGYDVQQLATTHTIEQVAALLWTKDSSAEQTIFAAGQSTEKYLHQLQTLHTDAQDLPTLQRLQIALALASADDLAAYDLDLRSGNTLQTGARILKLITSVLTDREEIDLPIAQLLQESWCPGKSHLIALFNAVLILCADHELNTSSFAARIVASAETQLYAVVIAGLAALQGFKHGGNTLLVESFLREVGTAEQARETIAQRLHRGEYLPGFGHRLYPHGDPRSILLLQRIQQAYPDALPVQLSNAVAAEVMKVTGKKPTLEFALVTLAHTLHLPDGSALALFALGRTIGWIGHAIEQYGSKQIIRPRAKYIGPR